MTATKQRWLRKIRGGGKIAETCPDFCAERHSVDAETPGFLVDLAHTGEFVETTLPVFDAKEGTVDMPVLSARISVYPYDDDDAAREPHVILEPWQDEPMVNLGPDQFAAVIAQIRAHCDRLDQVHAQLVQARAEWNGAAR